MMQNPAPTARPTQGGSQPTLPIPPTPPTPPSMPGSTGVPREYPNGDVPEGVVIISVMFFAVVAFVIVGLPLARAWARRLDRGASAPAGIPREVTERLAHIENAVDSIALEVERISEGQRFTTRLLADKHGETAGVRDTA